MKNIQNSNASDLTVPAVSFILCLGCDFIVCYVWMAFISICLSHGFPHYDYNERREKSSHIGTYVLGGYSSLIYLTSLNIINVLSFVGIFY